MSFEGKRVLSLESRRANETAELIRRNGGEPFVAPALREAPIESNPEVFRFADRLLAGEFDMVILLTGVGLRLMMKTLATQYDTGRIVEALRNVTIAARGPKPVAALRELGLAPQVTAPEPNTYRELLKAMEGRTESRIAVQEYGRSNDELLSELRRRGAEVTAIPVYTYDLPTDIGPLKEAIRRLVASELDVALFTTAQQVAHLFSVAHELGKEEEVKLALERMLIGSIGPTTTEMLAEHGITPTLHASHPKLGMLVKEVAEWSGRS